jgi:hypothetical protein
MAALTATACGQAVDAGACGVWLTAAAVAAAWLIPTRGKLVGHQGVDVAWQFIAIAAWAAIVTGYALARWTVVTAPIKATIRTWAVATAAFKAGAVAAVLALGSRLAASAGPATAARGRWTTA